jgi:hypothetical protein
MTPWVIKSRRMTYEIFVQILVGKSEGKRLLGRPKRRWKENIKVGLKETEYEGADWINVAQDSDK